MTKDRTDMAYWFRLIRTVSPVPPTVHVDTTLVLSSLLDGVEPHDWKRGESYGDFIDRLQQAGEAFGWPCFLRTGYGSGKHEWRSTCWVPSPSAMSQHVYALVEWSHIVDIGGLPYQDWFVRKMLDVEPLFHAFDGMPITREFRVFFKGDEYQHIQPYWIPKAIHAPDRIDWRDRLRDASQLKDEEAEELCYLAGEAMGAVGAVDEEHWSIDFLQDRDGQWWLTDMADGDKSFAWCPRCGTEYEAEEGHHAH